MAATRNSKPPPETTKPRRMAILRSRQEKAQPQAKGEFISASDQNTLAAVLQMRDVLAGEVMPLRNALLKYHVDDKGTVIFSLPDNITIRDAGQAIYFSANNARAVELATRAYASNFKRVTRKRGDLAALRCF
jgi:hypothetical protein